MAKGARSSVRKANNKKLKARVFGPVENARAERLSAKLIELASQPKPPKEKMDVEGTSGIVLVATWSLGRFHVLVLIHPQM